MKVGILENITKIYTEENSFKCNNVGKSLTKTFLQYNIKNRYNEDKMQEPEECGQALRFCTGFVVYQKTYTEEKPYKIYTYVLSSCPALYWKFHTLQNPQNAFSLSNLSSNANIVDTLENSS